MAKVCIYYEPCRCGEMPRHSNGGNYHLRVAVGRDLAVRWNTREAMGPRDGAVVLRRGDELGVLTRAEYIDRDDFHAELDEYLSAGWEIIAQPADGWVISLDEARRLIQEDWRCEEI